MSGSNTERLAGLQVVKLSEQPGQRYEVDEKALASVLLRPDVRNLPVVVVSVAGGFRGGKSFILDFFLRYLTAPRSSQLNGEWLGSEDQILEGFDWRGGGERNTQGIHLWPEPIIVTIQRTGEKVAVLLMDTQGTFDPESDMCDNSTIFALSTLLSSVQVYNVKENIKEDDLQNLQLFTEYGRLVSTAEGKAFQTLLFLVRDWMSPYEHPHGYGGGEVLLNKRLTPKPNQKLQLREVREHIHSCFEKLQCFLMPHPGLVVSKAYFRGRICDIEEDFKESLLELVPSLFEQKNLISKIINGEKVQAQGLLEYFKQYVQIFNSDNIPEATTIFQATVNACLMSALKEARECYNVEMNGNIIEGQSVTPDMIHEWHDAAVAAAVLYFREKKKLGSQDKIESHLQNLQEELNDLLSPYLWQNDAIVRDTVSAAKNSYYDTLQSMCKDQARLCLHSRDLHALYNAAWNDAFIVFDQTRKGVPQELDTERNSLAQDLAKNYEHMCLVNEQNNRSALLEASQIYTAHMKEHANKTGVSSNIFQIEHKNALDAAIKHFHSRRNQPTEETDDPDVQQLMQDIEQLFKDLENLNANSSLYTMQMVEYTYNNYINTEWEPQFYCYHPRALLKLHEAARSQALQQYFNNKTEGHQDDEFKEEIIAKLEICYERLQRINHTNNKEASDRAFGEYTRFMGMEIQQLSNSSSPVAIDQQPLNNMMTSAFSTAPKLSTRVLTGFTAASLFLSLAPLLFQSKRQQPNHEAAKLQALNIFKERRLGHSYDDDGYLNSLKEKIDQAYAGYRR